MKRIFDFLLAVILILPAFFICIFVAPVIYYFDRVPPLFRQTRVGMHNREFVLFKLRTMAPTTPNAATHEITTAQLTRTGPVLRRFKIDELPQILNVLNGTMSFVGPRPCLPSQIDLINERVILGVSALRPGITGPAQIIGLDMSTPAKLALVDSSYLVDWSIGRDVVLILKTIVGNGRGDAIAEE